MSFVKSAPSRGGSRPHLIHRSARKQHLDRFSRFCTPHSCAQRTDIHTGAQTGALKMREWKMREWKIQELKHMESRPYRNLWRSKLQSGCVWLSMVESRQLVASPTELTGLVPRVGCHTLWCRSRLRLRSTKTPSLYSLVVLSFFRGRVCNAYDNYSRMLVYCMIWLLVWYVPYVHLSMCPYVTL